MPVQDPDVRNKNFDEVALGYTYDMAVNEARRCLNCKNKPCVSACPVQINIPAFIERVANEDIEGAFAILSESTSLPAVCYCWYAAAPKTRLKGHSICPVVSSTWPKPEKKECAVK